MLTEKELNAAINRITGRLDEVNRLYVKKIAAQILKIGELSQSSINSMINMVDTGADVQEITHQLQLATTYNIQDIMKIYNAALNDTYTDPRFKTFLNNNAMPRETRYRLNLIAQHIATQTAGTMQNISNTTAVQQGYKDAIDKAILAVTTGVGDYQSAIRSTIRNIGYNGLQVEYESGYHRRLDSAVRQNIIDGVNQINQNASLAMGEMLDMDAIELSAHLRSAPDHEPVQGRVFLKEEFEKMQSGMDFEDIDGNHYAGFSRPIGEWNCRHIAMSFSSQHSIRRYSDKQLKDWSEANNKGCEVGGKHYTIYQASQLMRRLETEVRREKDSANAARAVKDDILRQKCQKRINALTKQYYAVANASGIRPDGTRLSVNGFSAVKIT